MGDASLIIIGATTIEITIDLTEFERLKLPIRAQRIDDIQMRHQHDWLFSWWATTGCLPPKTRYDATQLPARAHDLDIFGGESSVEKEPLNSLGCRFDILRHGCDGAKSYEFSVDFFRKGFVVSLLRSIPKIHNRRNGRNSGVRSSSRKHNGQQEYKDGFH